MDPDVDWLDEAEELDALVGRFVEEAGALGGLTAASAQRETDEVREFVYCLDGADRDVAGRVEITLGSEQQEPRVVFFSRYLSPEPCS